MENDYWNVDLESFWAQATEALVLFYGKTWDEAVELIKGLRVHYGCDEPGYDPYESFLFHDLPYRIVEGVADIVKPGVEEYYHKKHYGG